jgi:hypothetical protein
MRRDIFFYDLADQVLPSTVGDLHHAPSTSGWANKFEIAFLASYVSTLRDAASCHNSNGFLATPYAG